MPEQVDSACFSSATEMSPLDEELSKPTTNGHKEIFLPSTVNIPKRENVDFEEALNETGFGRYSIFLIIVCGLVLFAVNSEAYGIGYVVPAAECELNLDNYKKGILTSTNLFGIMGTCAIWGYVSDIKGRRRLLIVNLILAFLTGLIAAVTPSFWGFCLLRLINGICISGPSVVVFVYLGEFLSTSTKAKSTAWGTSFVAFAMTALPCLGWIMLQKTFNIEFLGLYLNNWRLYMLVNSLTSVVAAVGLLYLPESPKYLYHVGKYDEALEVIRNIYAGNTGKAKGTFPVRSLSKKQLPSVQSSGGFTDQIVPLFKPPLLTYTFASCFLQASAFAISSGLYSWYPDIIERITSSGKSSVTVCEALSISIDKKEALNCDNTVDDGVFILNIIVGVSYIVAFATWGIVVKAIGTRNFFISCMAISAVTVALLCFISNKILIDVLFTASLTLPGITVTVINAWLVDIFPTNICGAALSIALTAGRFGSVISSSVVGIMLEWSCWTTFLLYSTSLVACVFVSLLLPQTR